MRIALPRSTSGAEDYVLRGNALPIAPPLRVFNRVVYAAAHVVADPLAAHSPHSSASIDWAATLRYRSHLLNLGFGIAEAMDTSQRGMGLDWPSALELIRQSLHAAGPKAHLIASGCGTDQLAIDDAKSLDDVLRAYLDQLHAIQKLGGRIILMASRALARVATSPDDYVKIYRRVLAEADHPVVLHWLGDMFDPALKGYWGAKDFAGGMATALAVINDNVAKVDGIKISLLDADKEIEMRRRLNPRVKMYTGDDFHYPDLIAGDAQGYSHALLGIFDAIAPAASLALSALAEGDRATYYRMLAPTVPLSRLIFKAPTQFYKTGIVFLAWLNGHQDHFVMINGAQSARALPDLIEIFKLADAAGLLHKPDLAVHRMKQLLGIYGF
jgi:Protein of unknown function (DUF993)